MTVFQIIGLTLIPSCCSLFLFVQDKAEKKAKGAWRFLSNCRSERNLGASPMPGKEGDGEIAEG